MNKKVIAVIGAVIIIAVVGILVYMFTGNNNSESTNNNNNESNNQVQNNNNDNNVSSDDSTNDGNILILYFSMTGNTEAVANFIHDEVGGDIVKLETQETYPDDYNDLLDVAQEEQSENARPELSTTIDNLDEYDTIFLGYPIWWGDMPMAIYSFLDNYDLSGKTIAPFVTSGGSGLSGTPSNIKNEEPNANVVEGLSIYDSDARSSRNEVVDWLNGLGY